MTGLDDGLTKHQIALRIDQILSACRTGAVLHPRWWRPSWDAGYRAGLKTAHDAAVAELVHGGCAWPTMPRPDNDTPREDAP